MHLPPSPRTNERQVVQYFEEGPGVCVSKAAIYGDAKAMRGTVRLYMSAGHGSRRAALQSMSAQALAVTGMGAGMGAGALLPLLGPVV